MSFPESLDNAVVSIFNVRTGSAIDLTGPGGAQNGNPIIGYPYHGGPNQQWKFERVQGDGVWPVYMIRNVQFKTYIDLYLGNAANGTKITGWAGGNTTNPHQLWRVVTADPKGRVLLIQNVGTNTYLDLTGGSPNPSTPIQGWEGASNFSNPNQQWRFLRLE